MSHDVIVVGGSYAGMAAALQLARGRRRVMVIDASERRNRFATHSHGFLSRDGTDAAEIAAIGRRQLEAYPNLEWRQGRARGATRSGDGFRIVTDDGAEHDARRLVLALGVTDTLPEVEGLAERWGRSVFHCPYCHGYELGEGPIGVLCVGAVSLHHALLLPEWGPTTFFLNGMFEPDAGQIEQLQARGVTVERVPVRRITGEADVELADGRVLSLAGLFTASRTEPASALGADLGCAMEDGPLGTFLHTGPTKETSVPGVFACGDAARAVGSVSFAVGDGAMAGGAAHQSLIFR